MRRIVFVTGIVSAYFWSINTGRDQFLLDQGKQICQLVAHWIEKEAPEEIQALLPPVATNPESKKRSRRWD